MRGEWPASCNRKSVRRSCFPPHPDRIDYYLWGHGQLMTQVLQLSGNLTNHRLWWRSPFARDDTSRLLLEARRLLFSSGTPGQYMIYYNACEMYAAVGLSDGSSTQHIAATCQSVANDSMPKPSGACRGRRPCIFTSLITPNTVSQRGNGRSHVSTWEKIQ